MTGDVHDSARTALEALRRNGSPVVRSDNVDAIAEAGMRRWNSFDRRNRGRSADHEARVEDLAKGLRDKFEPDRTLVGPLMTDYRHLARTLAAAFTSSH